MKAHIKIPKGWRLVRQGKSVDGDRYFLPSGKGGGTWSTVNCITETIVLAASNFIFLIRRKK